MTVYTTTDDSAAGKPICLKMVATQMVKWAQREDVLFDEA